MIKIEESGMVFGPYAKSDCYVIEKSKSLKGLGEGVKIAEFVLLKNNFLWIVEAKSSMPKVTDDFLCEIHDKLLNSLTLTLMGIVGRHDSFQKELPVKIRQVCLKNLPIKLCLVISAEFLKDNSQLPPINEKFRKIMKSVRKTWKVTYDNILILNEEMAIKQGLINE